MTIMAPATAAALLGKPLDAATLQAGLAALREDVRIADDAPGAPPRGRAPGACGACGGSLAPCPPN